MSEYSTHKISLPSSTRSSVISDTVLDTARPPTIPLMASYDYPQVELTVLVHRWSPLGVWVSTVGYLLPPHLELSVVLRYEFEVPPHL